MSFNKLCTRHKSRALALRTVGSGSSKAIDLRTMEHAKTVTATHMLPPAATLHVHAGQFQGLLGAMEAFAAPGCTWKNWRSCLRYQMFYLIFKAIRCHMEVGDAVTSHKQLNTQVLWTELDLIGWYKPFMPELHNFIHQLWNVYQRSSFDFLSTRWNWKRKRGYLSLEVITDNLAGNVAHPFLTSQTDA
ncbi:hypothetical protein EMCRGX_G011381 [Ephydatia muelleri]